MITRFNKPQWIGRDNLHYYSHKQEDVWALWTRKWRRVCLLYINMVSWESGWFSRQEW